MNTNTLLIILTLAGVGFGIYYFSRNNSNSDSSESSGGSGGSGDSDTEIRTVRNPGRVEPTEPNVPEQNPSPVSGGGSGGGTINQPVQSNPVTNQNQPDQQTSKQKEQVETEKLDRQQKKVQLVGTQPNNTLKNVNGITRDNLDQTAKKQVSKNLDNGLFKGNKFING
jgi:hypothetical protein